MSKLIGISRAAKHGAPMESLEAVELIEDFGVEGDRQARKGRSRQVLIMPNEVLADLDLEPGQGRENLTTQGLAIMSLAAGTHLKVGEALLEVTKAAAPCQIMDQVRMGLSVQLEGQRGMGARVLKGGRVRRGDAIEVVS